MHRFFGIFLRCTIQAGWLEADTFQFCRLTRELNTRLGVRLLQILIISTRKILLNWQLKEAATE